MHILRRKRFAIFACLLLVSCIRWLKCRLWLLFQLVQANRRFQHEQNVKSLFPDVLYHTGYMF